MAVEHSSVCTQSLIHGSWYTGPNYHVPLYTIKYYFVRVTDARAEQLFLAKQRMLARKERVQAGTQEEGGQEVPLRDLLDSEGIYSVL